jgi:GntR family transcriptional regulator/MocR family aminotransferase
MRTSLGPLFVQLEPDGRDPLQVQLYASIKRAILEGVLAAGARLPSSRALAADLKVSRTTAMLAFDRLAAEGYIAARGGSGTFVMPQLQPAGHVQADARRRHPPLSARGQVLAASPATVVKIDGAPRAFRIGTPALDLFPRRQWARLLARQRRRPADTTLDYGPAFGLPMLREAIAGHVSRARGTSCRAEQVVVVAGAQHGLHLLCHLLLDPGDLAWVEEPGYPGARAALAAAAAVIEPVPVDAQGLDVECGRWRPRTPRVIYVTPSHQFPLGVTMSLPRRQSLLAFARDVDAWILEDDYDSEFRYGARPAASLHGLDPDGRVIYVGSFSKTLFPALRLGYVIVPADLVEAVRVARRATDIHTPALEQALVGEFILEGHYERHLRRMRREYVARRDALADAVRRRGAGALSLRETTTGLHAVADLCAADAVVVAREALSHGVEVMPLSAYYQDAGAVSRDGRTTAGGLVLGFGAVRPGLIDAGMRTLAAAIEHAGRSRA